jgi:competence protein ComGB
MERFRLLLNNGLDIQTMIELSFQDAPEILSRLEQGQELADILTGSMETRYNQSVRILSRCMPLEKALDSAERIEKATHDSFMNFFREIAYPLFIFVFCYGFILFFSSTILPTMSMYTENTNAELFVGFLKLFYTLICVGVLSFAGIAKMISSSRAGIRWLHRFSWLRLYDTYQFSIYFHVLCETGLATTDCVELLTQLSRSKRIQIYAADLLSSIRHGVPMERALNDASQFDADFGRFISIGIHSSEISKLLSLYEQRAEHLLKQKIKHAAVGVQILSYLSVALLVFVFYQIMLMPLNMLSTF